ncbi:MAG: Gfo/Idh/MocA family oxidoreductase [Clostridiales bacterium]|nr:Gfo/Idh/MocA family oxidoreductase [Clostridiales bacterium]
MKKQPLKAAVIGTGMIAHKAHIPAYQSMADYYTLDAVMDKTMASAQQTADLFGIKSAYDDVQKMFLEVQPDIVSICTPSATHAAFARLALQHGAHVLCEKPLALCYKETKELFDLAAKQNRMIMACQTLRYHPDYLAAHHYAQAGTLGPIYYAEFSAIRRRGIPTWGSFHRKAASGGGCLSDLGVHMLDAAIWIMGCPRFASITGTTAALFGQREEQVHTSLAESGAPAGISTKRRYNPSEFDVEGFAAGSIRFENGALLNFKTAWAVNLPPRFNLTMAGEKAGFSLPEMTLYSVLHQYQADITPRIFHEGPYDHHPFSGHFYLIENAARHLLYQEDLMVKPQETLLVTALIEGFYVAAAKGREVRADEIMNP